MSEDRIASYRQTVRPSRMEQPVIVPSKPRSLGEIVASVVVLAVTACVCAVLLAFAWRIAR